MSANPFKRFYNTDVKLFMIKETGVYSKTRQVNELCGVKADVQPYNGGLLAKEYGLEAECEYKMFCENNEHLTEGNYAEIYGQRYKIIYVEPWSIGAVVILQKVTV